MRISRLVSSWCAASRAWSAAPPSDGGAHGLAARERDRRQRGIGLRAPWCVPGQERQRSFTCAAERSTSSTSAGSGAAQASRSPGDEARRLDGQPGQRLAPRGRLPRFGGHRDGLLEMAAHAVRVARAGPDHPAPRLELDGAAPAMGPWRSRRPPGRAIARPRRRRRARGGSSPRRRRRGTRSSGRPGAWLPDAHPRRATGPGPAPPWPGRTRGPRTASGGPGGPVRSR